MWCPYFVSKIFSFPLLLWFAFSAVFFVIIFFSFFCRPVNGVLDGFVVHVRQKGDDRQAVGDGAELANFGVPEALVHETRVLDDRVDCEGRETHRRYALEDLVQVENDILVSKYWYNIPIFEN